MDTLILQDDAVIDLRDDRRIQGQGTPESEWQAWPGLGQIAEMSLDQLVPPGRRCVVVAPHPDDEVLACGGLLAMLAARRRADIEARERSPYLARQQAKGFTRQDDPLLVVGVTDGEASHPGSRMWTPERLAVQRRAERAIGMRRLGWHLLVHAAGLPDGGVTEQEEVLAVHLMGLVRPGDVLLTPWRQDGHPDHEATGRACARVKALTGVAVMEMPVWAWHWAAPGDARVPWDRLRRIALDEPAMAAKRLAIEAHRSQLLADQGRPPVLPLWALDRLLRPFEYVFLPEGDA